MLRNTVSHSEQGYVIWTYLALYFAVGSGFLKFLSSVEEFPDVFEKHYDVVPHTYLVLFDSVH